MKQIDFQHPYPRYGFAAALATSQEFEFPEHLETWLDVRNLALSSLKGSLNFFSVSTTPLLEGMTELKYSYVSANNLKPGKADGQMAAKGFFLAPHVVTSDGSAANTVIEAHLLIKALEKCKEEKDIYKPYDLKRSFAPLTSKVNNGGRSAQNPKASLRDAAFTCIATLTRLKPAVYAAFLKNSFTNAVLIPDLPLYAPAEKEGELHNPMLDFVKEFRQMQDALLGKNLMKGEVGTDGKSYRRPNLHKGNYPNAPNDRALNAVSLVASIAEWYKENLAQGKRAEHIKAVLESLEGRPLYIISYEFARQERFSHHLISLALEHDLLTLQKAVWRSKIYGVDRADDPKRQLFNLAYTHFLQLYTSTDFKNFMAYRAEYPAEYSPTFDKYFMDAQKLPSNLVRSARLYGQSLNYAVYVTASRKIEDETKGNISKEERSARINTEKAKILAELESRVLSTRRIDALFSQISITIGRMTGRDFYPEAGDFMEAALTEQIDVKQAQNLITAFMRLSSKLIANPREEKELNLETSTAE